MGYILHKVNRETKKEVARETYTNEELNDMSIFELKNLCIKHKIIKIYQQNYTKEKLIDIILKYRGNEEKLIINKADEEGIIRIQNFLQKNYVQEMPNQQEIKIPAKITIYEGIGINKEDMYKVIAPEDFQDTNVLLVKGNNELCGIFSIENDTFNENSFYLCADSENIIDLDVKAKNYSFIFFKKDDSEFLHKMYYSEKIIPNIRIYGYKVNIVDFEVRSLEVTKTSLCIDFGTSNTTVGCFLDSNYVGNISNNDILNKKIKLNAVNFVKFLDYSGKEEKWIEMIPTVVYVEDCEKKKTEVEEIKTVAKVLEEKNKNQENLADSEKEKIADKKDDDKKDEKKEDENEDIRYLFGYEAKRKMKKNDYSTTASIFHSIKRWVNTYDENIDIFDEKGNSRKIKKADIIKAFMKYIVKCAEHQFKCKFVNIHVSSPVKLKVQFLSMFKEIMVGYNIETENVLDEGMSVLYNTISNLIEKESFEDNFEYKALVIDCGGGTTDLSSCAFKIKKGEVSYEVGIKTSYENGDTNFGGDNITFRIMQFMKIIFANYYRNNKEIIDIDKLIDFPTTDIFRQVDEFGIASVYEDFENYYKEAEETIPTRFKDYENKIGEQYQKVKNNFYFMWELAENMKKEFFQKTNILRNRFDSSEDGGKESDLNITQLNRWALSIKSDNDLVAVNEFPKVVFNIKEINKLIKGDIYEIVRKFLDKFYESRELTDFSIIKLTGQSCRIDTFKEALKEFVPGKSIEFRQKNDKNSLELKLACLSGVIKYLNSKKKGDIVVNIENEIPVVPYALSAFTFTGKEVVLMESMERIDNTLGSIIKPNTTAEIKFYLKDENDVIKKEYIYFNNEEYSETTPEELDSICNGKIVQDDTDNLNDGELKFFVYTKEDAWGFYVLPVMREFEQLYVAKETYYPFEDDLSELNFFDGKK